MKSLKTKFIAKSYNVTGSRPTTLLVVGAYLMAARCLRGYLTITFPFSEGGQRVFGVSAPGQSSPPSSPRAQKRLLLRALHQPPVNTLHKLLSNITVCSLFGLNDSTKTQ
jgi:hypothetical protein